MPPTRVPSYCKNGIDNAVFWWCGISGVIYINSFGMGTYRNFFFRFQSVWWKAQWLEYSYVIMRKMAHGFIYEKMRKTSLFENMRKDGSYLHAITYNHSNRWHLLVWINFLKFHYHLTCVDTSFRLVKIRPRKLKKIKRVVNTF